MSIFRCFQQVIYLHNFKKLELSNLFNVEESFKSGNLIIYDSPFSFFRISLFLNEHTSSPFLRMKKPGNYFLLLNYVKITHERQRFEVKTQIIDVILLKLSLFYRCFLINLLAKTNHLVFL